MATRKDWMGLMEKLEISHSSKMSSARAKKKLTAWIAENGTPDDLAPEDEALIGELGIAVPKAKPEAEQPGEPEAEGKAEEKAERLSHTPEGHKPHGNATQAFKDAWKGRKRIGRKELVEKVVSASGVMGYSVGNYISSAKKPDNPFGFQIKDGENKSGEKILMKVE